jgi:hypothetical protein
MRAALVDRLSRHRRRIGFLMAALSVFPIFTVSMPAYVEPFRPTQTAEINGYGDPCADGIGLPPVFGLWASCNVYLTGSPTPRDGHRSDGRLWGPMYPELYTSGPRSIMPVVTTPVGLIQAPRGWHRVLGFAAPWTLIAGLLLLFWPRRYQRISPGERPAPSGSATPGGPPRRTTRNGTVPGAITATTDATTDHGVTGPAASG